jgi:hypothetical protein
MAEWTNVKDALEIYEKALGQMVNCGKTAIFFSRNTKEDIKTEITHAVGMSFVQSYERYLGLSALVGHSKVRTFANIKGKVWDRLNGWKEKFLSQAGREIPIKVVI